MPKKDELDARWRETVAELHDRVRHLHGMKIEEGYYSWQMSKRIGMSTSRFCNIIENGTTTIDILFKVARAMGATVHVEVVDKDA